MKSITRFNILLLFIFISGTAYSQTVRLEAPTVFPMGKNFKVEYIIDVNPDDFIGPESFEGFNVIAGPINGFDTNVNIINGNFSTVHIHRISYMLRAPQSGIYNIPPAKYIVNGKEFLIKGVPVEIVDEGDSPRQSPSANPSRPQTGTPAAPSGQFSKDDIVIRALVDKTSVFKDQPIRLTFKIYYRTDIAGVEGSKAPVFNGFWTQEINRDSKAQPSQKSYNSKVYQTEVMSEYILYPQQTGQLVIDPLELDLLLEHRIPLEPRSLADAFFGGNYQISREKLKVKSSPVTITVSELPAGAPASFNGAVGNYEMKTELTSREIAANSSSTFSVKISGTGNISFVQAPKIEFPSTFEKYDSPDNISTRNNAGSKIFSYNIIPRAEGTYSIPPFEFSFFDPNTGKYVTLLSNEEKIRVLPDSSGNSVSAGTLIGGITREELKILNRDIRFIKLDQSGFVKGNSLFVLTPVYLFFIVLLLALTILLYFLLKKHLALRNDINFMKGKKANKVALQRLKAAEEYMGKNQPSKFYEEMLKALWGYMSDKLNIPFSVLTKERVREELSRRNVSSEGINTYVDLISDCEYSQYSPEETGHMKDIYKKAIQSITKLESVLSK